MRARGAKRRSTAMGWLAAFGALTALVAPPRRARPRRPARRATSTARATRSAASTCAATTSASTGPTPSDKPYGSFAALAQDFGGARADAALCDERRHVRRRSLAGRPLCRGRQAARARRHPRRRRAISIFMPNGVFWIGDGVAGVEETSRYLADPPAARFATQSGPMLVIDGRIHPKILPTGTSEKIRNGVCVRDGTTAIFAISEEPVTFYAFARLFRDGLGCANALVPRRLGVVALCARTRPRRRIDAARADDRRQRAGVAVKSSGGSESPAPARAA